MVRTSRVRVGVIGLGTMGSQALKVLAETPGVEVTGFEQYAPGHDRGAAGGETRIFRSAQFEDARYVPILQRADELWKKLDIETGRELRGMTGCVLMGPPDHRDVKTAMESVTEHGLSYELLDRAQAAERFPQFRMDEGDMAIYDRNAGFIRPELTIHSVVKLAERLGATVHRRTTVTGLASLPAGGVRVVTDRGAFEFDRVIVAAGPWVNRLVPGLAETISIRRPISAWYTVREDESLPGGGPAFIRLAPRHFYGVPSPDGVTVKIGLSVVDHLVVDSPDTAERRISLEELAPFEEVLHSYLPTLDPDPFRVTSYFEGYIADTRPIVRTVPGQDDVILLAGFSGHGFKLAPAIGEIGAHLALGEPAGPEITFLERDLAAALV